MSDIKPIKVTAANQQEIEHTAWRIENTVDLITVDEGYHIATLHFVAFVEQWGEMPQEYVDLHLSPFSHNDHFIRRTEKSTQNEVITQLLAHVNLELAIDSEQKT